MTKASSKKNTASSTNIFMPIVESLHHITGLPVSIWVPDKANKALKIGAAVGLPENYIRSANLDLGRPSVIGDAFRSKKIQRIMNIETDPRWKYKKQAKEMNWKSAVCFPIDFDGMTIGVITVYAYTEHSISDLVRILPDFVNQIYLTIKVSRQNEILQRLLDTSVKLQSMIEDPKNVLNEIVRGVCDLTGASSAYIYPFDSGSGNFYEIENVASYGLTTKLNLSEKPRTQTGMAALVIRKREVVVGDIEKQEPIVLSTSPFINREGIKAFMGIVLQTADSVLGVLYINFQTPHFFAETEKDTIRLFAHQAAIAIWNARLYGEARSDAIAAKQLATLGTAIAALQHRVNNTLNIIIPNIKRLRSRINMDDPTVKEILDIIERNTRYTSDILLRIQTPLQEVESSSVNVNSLLSEIAEIAKKEWLNSSSHPVVKIKLNLDESIPLIQVPVGQISEIIRNLIDNAYRAMKKGGKIIITSKMENHSICIRFEDTAKGGIPPTVRERLFQKPVPSKEPGQGAGLGLWLGKLILQSIGGDVTIEETSVSGTTMLLQIPASKAGKDR